MINVTKSAGNELSVLYFQRAVFPADFTNNMDKNASATDEKIARPRVRGVDLLRDPLLNKVQYNILCLMRKFSFLSVAYCNGNCKIPFKHSCS